MLSPAQIIGRLEEIETDLAMRQNSLETVATDFYAAKRDWELEEAKARLAADGTVQERRDRGLLALAKSDVYKRFILAEAAYEGQKAAYRALETRASIGQSLLRAHTREQFEGRRAA